MEKLAAQVRQVIAGLYDSHANGARAQRNQQRRATAILNT